MRALHRATNHEYLLTNSVSLWLIEKLTDSNLFASDVRCVSLWISRIQSLVDSALATRQRLVPKQRRRTKGERKNKKTKRNATSNYTFKLRCNFFFFFSSFACVRECVDSTWANQPLSTNRLTVNGEKIDAQSDNKHSVFWSHSLRLFGSNQKKTIHNGKFW